MEFIKNLTKLDYEDKFFKYGLIRVGSVSSFRNIEDPEKGDALEGVRGYQFVPQKKTVLASEMLSLPENIQIRQTNGKPALLILDEGAELNVGAVAQNAYVFCVSESKKNNLGEFGYVISDLEKFAEILVQGMREDGIPITSFCVKKIIYTDHKNSLGSVDELISAGNWLKQPEILDDYYFTKSKNRFEADQEWRIVMFTEESHQVEKEKYFNIPGLASIANRYYV